MDDLWPLIKRSLQEGADGQRGRYSVSDRGAGDLGGGRIRVTLREEVEGEEGVSLLSAGTTGSEPRF